MTRPRPNPVFLVAVGFGGIVAAAFAVHLAQYERTPDRVLPAAEDGLCRIANRYTDAAKRQRAAQNSLNNVALRPLRAKELAAVPLEVTGWLGIVRGADQLSSGDGFVRVALPCRTMPMLIGSVEKGTPVFQRFASLPIGSVVLLAGAFRSDPQDGLLEKSITEQGSLEAPEFAFRFDSVERAPELK